MNPGRAKMAPLACYIRCIDTDTFGPFLMVW
jgi:hypothetical protein